MNRFTLYSLLFHLLPKRFLRGECKQAASCYRPRGRKKYIFHGTAIFRCKFYVIYYICIELIIIVDRHLMVMDGHFTSDGPRGNVTDKLSCQSSHARRSLQVSSDCTDYGVIPCHSIFLVDTRLVCCDGCFHYCYVKEPDAAKSRA